MAPRTTRKITKRPARKPAKRPRKAKKPASKLGSGTRFAELSARIAADYRCKGYSWAEAEQIGMATAASIGRRKYGGKRMASMAARGKTRAKARVTQ